VEHGQSIFGRSSGTGGEARRCRRIENVRQYLRANWLVISVFDDYDAIVDACCNAWKRFAGQPDLVSSITSRQWAQVNP
jgi:hypothetical protein